MLDPIGHRIDAMLFAKVCVPSVETTAKQHLLATCAVR